MSKELVIGSNRHETKVAVLEDDQLVEIYFQRANEYSLAGSIHKGRVTRVLPGMQSAFVDLGLDRDTFLYVSDFFEEHEDFEPLGDDKPVRPDRRDRGSAPRPARPPEERPAEPRESAPASPDAAAPESVTVAEEEASGPSSSAEPASRSPEPGGGFRDRRGRRSRRRRQRGPGFPEMKYAQPAPPHRIADPAPAAAQEAQEQPPADVIILPGESLAKYRHIAGDEHPSEDNSDTELPKESNDADEEDLEAEAEELELTEKILTHHDDESPEEVEEKIEEVKQDQPIPPSDAAEQAEAQQAVPDDLDEDFDHEVEPEFDAAVESEGEPALESDIEPEVEPEVEHDHEQERQTGTATAGEASPAQTATLREPGGRYLHRVSRRMRRRRGGNRFGQSSPEFTGRGETAAAAGAATAPAVEPEPKREARDERSGEKPERLSPSISDLLKPGQEIIVQIAKEPLGQKGARITSHVALPGRYVVFMPSVNHLGVSRRVSSEEERQRLKRILQAHRVGTTGGFIIRTAGEGAPEHEIAADMKYLYNLWTDIREKAERKPAPALLHYDVDIVQRLLRDQVTEDFKTIWVDDEQMYENVVTFMQRFQPALVNRVRMYTRAAPIFDAFNITQELERALRPKVWLKSGGYIVINQTEALVAIDINTGKDVGKSNRLEDTIVKTNTEAVKEIVRQIRLRDLGGIIVVDFIDMDERKNRQKVMQALEEAMRADKAPYKILQFNDFGLVAITRKRVKQSLERTLCSACPYCDGAGYVKSVQTVISEILVEAQKISKAIEGKDVVLRTHPEVAKVLKASNNQYLEELEEILGRPVLVTGDATLHHEKFDWA
jgi:ribonuclease G